MTSANLDEMFDCHVINLARTPERMAAFYRQNGGCGLAFRRFEAVDGNSIDPDDAVRNKIIKPNTKWDTKGTLGVALSHRTLWEKAIAEQRPLMVFEDDAYVREDFKTSFGDALAHVSDWDIILLGYNTDSLLEIDMISGFVFDGLFALRYPSPEQLRKFAMTRMPTVLLRLRHAFGICGYAVSPSGAAKLRDGCFPMDNRMLEFPNTGRRFRAYSIDGLMNSIYASMKAYVCVPPLVLPPNDKSKSTVTPNAL
jgi:glycosyl transferase family 25